MSALSSVFTLAQGGAPATGTAPPPAAADSINILTYVHQGGVLSYILIGLSVVAVTLVIRNIIAIRYERFAPKDVMARLESLLGTGKLVEAEAFCRQDEHECMVTRVLAQSFERCARSDFGMLEFRSVVEQTAQLEADEVHRMNDGIGIIAAIGPMLGLLGTVFGMIGAFRAIGALEGAARSNELATFMSLALVNTAEGLVVAIPCTVAFAMFRRQIDKVMSRVGNDLEHLVSMVSVRNAPKGGAAQAPRPSPARGGVS
ncbi:MAG: MotA/TolQ/ExbB proton channel family protein [Phycisphaerales bacterium]